MNLNADLPRLALSLEYVDMAAALYLAGGSDFAARLLAAAAEQQLGDLARLLGDEVQDNDELQRLLRRVAQHYAASAPTLGIDGHEQARRGQKSLTQLGQMAGVDSGAGSEVRQATESLLRAAWYLLESMGLEGVAPLRLQMAIERSTVHGFNLV